MGGPVVIPSAGEAVVRLCALREGNVITAALRCADTYYGVDHAKAEFSLVASAESKAVVEPMAAAFGTRRLADGDAGLVDGTELYRPICFQSGRFRRITFFAEGTARSGRALPRGPDEQPWVAAGSGLA